MTFAVMDSGSAWKWIMTQKVQTERNLPKAIQTYHSS